jgi:hypothetical protein
MPKFIAIRSARFMTLGRDALPTAFPGFLQTITNLYDNQYV